MEYSGPLVLRLIGVWLVICNSVISESTFSKPERDHKDLEKSTGLPEHISKSVRVGDISINHANQEIVSQYLMGSISKNYPSNTGNLTYKEVHYTNSTNTVVPNENIIKPIAIPSAIDTLPIHPRIPRKTPLRRKTRRRLRKQNSSMIPGKPVRYLLPPLRNEITLEEFSATSRPATSTENIVVITSPSAMSKISSTNEAISEKLELQPDTEEPQTIGPQYRKVFIPPPLRFLLPPFFYENYINAQPSTTLSPSLPDNDSSKPFAALINDDVNSQNYHLNLNTRSDLHESLPKFTSIVIVKNESESTLDDNGNHLNYKHFEIASPTSSNDNPPRVSEATTNRPSKEDFHVQSTTPAVRRYSHSTIINISHYGEYISRPTQDVLLEATSPTYSHQHDMSLDSENVNKFIDQTTTTSENHENDNNRYSITPNISVPSYKLTPPSETYISQNNSLNMISEEYYSKLISSSTLIPPINSHSDNVLNTSLHNIAMPSSTIIPPLESHPNSGFSDYSQEYFRIPETIPFPSSTLSSLEYYPNNDFNNSFQEYSRISETISFPSSSLTPPLESYPASEFNTSFDKYTNVVVPSTLRPPLESYPNNEFNGSFDTYSKIPVPSSTLSPPPESYPHNGFNSTFENSRIGLSESIPFPSSTLSPPSESYTNNGFNINFENSRIGLSESIAVPSSTLSPPSETYTNNGFKINFENSRIGLSESIPVLSSTISPPLESHPSNGFNIALENSRIVLPESMSASPPTRSSSTYPHIIDGNMLNENFSASPLIPSSTLTPPAQPFLILSGPNIEQALFETGEFGFELSQNDSMESTMSMMNKPLLSPEVAQAGMKIMANLKINKMKKNILNRGKLKYNHLNQFKFQNQTELLKESLKSKTSQLAVAESSYYDGSGKFLKQNDQQPDLKLIPGRPGKDYPILSNPPSNSNFSCQSVVYHRGYVADHSTRCQVFYICVGNGPGEPMLCPNGTVFSQDFLVCDWWFNVDCRQQI